MVFNRTTSRLIHNVAPELICFRKSKPMLILLYQCEKNILNLTFNDYFIQFPLPYFVIICLFLTHSEGEKDFYFPWKPSLMLVFLKYSDVVDSFLILMSIFNVCGSFPENGKREEFFLQRTSITHIIFFNYFNL